ncbi:unnamed protein product [Prunus armeniaca]|uniref:Uncharacterized protein n=1 Tax=Prunus armeniaca TaxID=36596 RepID=A0A6J5Y2U9_PRUAR|nr:unnamed protein product [Prunus armeniaca]
MCSTCDTDVVYHRPRLIEDDFDLSSFGSTFVDFLTQHRLLPLVRGLPLPNFQIFREFYANFPDVSTAFASLSEIVVRVRGVSISLSFHFISVALSQAPIRSGSSCEPVLDFLPCRQLVNRLYVKVSWKAAHILFHLLIEHSVNVEFYIRESLIVVGAANAIVQTTSLVLPRIITALVLMLVSLHCLWMILALRTIKVNNQITLHHNDAHCTSGSFSIEQHALLDSLSASRQVTHALLHRIWDRLNTCG